MSKARLIAATAIAPVIWGTTYLVTTEMLPDDKPLTAAVLRALPAGLILLALTRKLPTGSWWWRALVLGTLNIGAFFALLFVSAYRLPGGVSATLSAIHPLLVAVLVVAVLHEAFSRRAFIAAALGLGGVAMVVLTPEAALDAIGVAAGLLAGLCTALGVILTKKWGRPVSLLTFTGWQLLAGSFVLIVPMLVFEGIPTHLTAVNVAGYLWLTIPGAAIAYFLWFRGILALPPTRVTVLAFLAPLTAALLGWIVLDQTLTPLQWLGAVTILAAVALGTTTRKPQPLRDSETKLAPASG